MTTHTALRKGARCSKSLHKFPSIYTIFTKFIKNTHKYTLFSMITWLFVVYDICRLILEDVNLNFWTLLYRFTEPRLQYFLCTISTQAPLLSRLLQRMPFPPYLPLLSLLRFNLDVSYLIEEKLMLQRKSKRITLISAVLVQREYATGMWEDRRWYVREVENTIQLPLTDKRMRWWSRITLPS